MGYFISLFNNFKLIYINIEFLNFIVIMFNFFNYM
jgi:hypothetical protein